MHINFRKLTLHNFLSFGHSSITFHDDGFIRVTGVNENPDDLAVSNGSGKSSLWEALVWALTGDTIRGTKQVSNIYGDDGTYVEVEFDLDKNTYNILRSKDHKEYKTNIRIMIDGKDCSGKGIRDSEKLLVQYLPDITASMLGSVIILGQGLPQKFTNNSPSGRKEVLEKLSKSDFMIEDLKRRVSNRRLELNKSIREIEDSILASTTTRNYLTEQIQVSEKALASLDGTSLQDQLNCATVELEGYTATKETCQTTIDELETQSVDTNKRLVQLNDEQRAATDAVESEYAPAIQDAEFTATRLNAEKNTKEREITMMENIRDVCPTCGQKLPDVHKPDTSALRTELQQLMQDYAEAEANRVALKKERDDRVSSISASYIKQKMELTATNAELSKKISSWKQDLRNVDNCITVTTSKISELQRLLAQLETTIANYQETISKNATKIRELDDQLMYNNSEKDLQQSHLDVVNKFETALKRDFRGYLLSTIIDYIQQRAKSYSQVIFETDKVGFCLDGNNIDITYLDKAYENLSGGEKQKIDLIIQFSIRDMLCNHLGFTSNILVLDEVFDGLDSIGCQRVLDVISSLSDIKNIFIVTHRKDLSIPTDKEIIVVKSASGISEIR